jgi:Uma2 family endonuclease
MSISPFDYPSPTGEPSQPGELTWELTAFFPRQGEWTEGEYLELESRGGRLVELVDGSLKVLPMPTLFHQLIVDYLHQQFKSFVVARKLGVVAFAPCPIRLRPKTFREPDIFFLRTGRCTDPKTQPEGADLAIEVVSEDPSDRKRDLVEKKADYAQAAIPEYWIVDPQERRITVLVLDGEQYRADGEYHPGQMACSKLLDGLEIDVAAVFKAGELPPA